jgi:integrase
MTAPIAGVVPAVLPAPLDRLPGSSSNDLLRAAHLRSPRRRHSPLRPRPRLPGAEGDAQGRRDCAGATSSPGRARTRRLHRGPHQRPDLHRGRRRPSLRLPARLRAAGPTLSRGRPPRRRHPHSLRHSYATESLRLGAALQDVQDALGHADPRTTRRYDGSRHNLDRSPNYLLASVLTSTDACLARPWPPFGRSPKKSCSTERDRAPRRT